MTTSALTPATFFFCSDGEGEDREFVGVFRASDIPSSATVEREVVAPASWTPLAVRVVTTKYLLPVDGNNIFNLVYRVVGRIVEKGVETGHIDEGVRKETELALVNMVLLQKASWNSPVWFNVGNPSQMEKNDEQAWACLILGVGDYMQAKDGPESIEEGWLREAETFRKGSGSGVNVSRIRAKGEPLSGGVGFGTGPISLWMKPTDAIAGVVSSGGRTRRAAKMVIMDVDHPEIMDFIDLKFHENQKAHDLKSLGYDISMNGRDSEGLLYQNANNSVRVTDDFMERVLGEGHWLLRPRLGRTPPIEIEAGTIWRALTEAAAACADPGIQFHDTINRWNTVAEDGEISGSNPCSEYMFLDNTVCNLGSINVLKFVDFENRTFDIGDFTATVSDMILTMDILCDLTSHVSDFIRQRALDYRTLGLGITNLGATLMALGIPYNSDAGRTFAAAVMSLLQARAYVASSLIAGEIGSYPRFDANRDPHLGVIELHAQVHEDRYNVAFETGLTGDITGDILRAASSEWKAAKRLARKRGVRNAQVSVIAPTGTISFMMDCETTGVEPVFSISAVKELVGGGSLDVSAQECVRMGLQTLGDGDVPGLLAFHSLFQTAIGQNALPPEAHVDMVCALQPFVSGAISKTINLPAGATAEDVSAAYLRGWKGGAKALAVYVDESKPFQPMNDSAATTTDETNDFPITYAYTEPPQTSRAKMPGTNANLVRHKFTIAGDHEFYLIAGFYPDGRLGEFFVEGSKEGSAFGGAVKQWAISTSMALQMGLSFDELYSKFRHQAFEPYGVVQSDTAGESEIRYCSSVADYIFNWLDWYINRRGKIAVTNEVTTVSYVPPTPAATTTSARNEPGLACPECGKMTYKQAGTCWQCSSCLHQTGCS